MKKPGTAIALFIVIVLAELLLFRGRTSQREGTRVIPAAGAVHQTDLESPEVISGRIISINIKEQAFMLDHGIKAFPLHWGTETAITIANHPVTPSALVPGASVIVQCQSKNDRDFARSIQIVPLRK